MIRAALTAALLLTAAPAAAQQTAGRYGPAVTLTQAERIIDAARTEAMRRDFAMVFAVVDPAGELVSLEKMDEAQNGSVDVAPAKARSAARFRRPTKAFSDAVTAGRVAILALEGAVPIEGGVPILSGGRVIGALGVSGGSSVEDGEVAAVALRALP